jgi:hypothetical protein
MLHPDLRLLRAEARALPRDVQREQVAERKLRRDPPLKAERAPLKKN